MRLRHRKGFSEVRQAHGTDVGGCWDETREARQCRALGLRGSHMNRGDQRPRDTRCGGYSERMCRIAGASKARASIRYHPSKVKTASHGDRAQPFSSYQRTAARCCLEDNHQEASEVTVKNESGT